MGRNPVSIVNIIDIFMLRNGSEFRCEMFITCFCRKPEFNSNSLSHEIYARIPPLSNEFKKIFSNRFEYKRTSRIFRSFEYLSRIQSGIRGSAESLTPFPKICLKLIK